MKEFLQLHMWEAFGPLKSEDITDQQKEDVLEILILLKVNCHGTLKAHGCADRRKQHEKYDNVDGTSPTVSTEAVLISTVIDV